MSPGTISGAPDPGDRLRTEGGERGFRRPLADAAAPADATTSPPPVAGMLPALDSRIGSGIAFLGIVAATCFFGYLLLSQPAMIALSALLEAFGIPVARPAVAGAPADAKLAAFFVQVVGTQGLFLLFACVGALWLPGRVRERLGLVRPRGGWRVLAAAVVLEVLTFLFGIAAVATFLPADYEAPARNIRLLNMLRSAPLEWWIAIVTAMSVMPGLAEEALFRGLIQRRLLELWRPAAAILITGLFFTLLHPPFVRSLMLLPGCLWLGYVAWRCGSILPGIVLHAGTNAGFQSVARFAPTSAPDTEPARWSLALVALASGASVAWLLWLVHRWTRVPAPPPAVPDEHFIEATHAPPERAGTIPPPLG